MLDIKFCAQTHKKWQRALKLKVSVLTLTHSSGLKVSDDVYKVKPKNCRTNAM